MATTASREWDSVTGRYDSSLLLAFRIARILGKPIEEIFDPT